jgi:hypothetical protein
MNRLYRVSEVDRRDGNGCAAHTPISDTRKIEKCPFRDSIEGKYHEGVY